MGKTIFKGERFQYREVWQSPRGTLYRVIAVADGEAILRMGSDGSGRKYRRYVDDIGGWSLYEPKVA